MVKKRKAKEEADKATQRTGTEVKKTPKMGKKRTRAARGTTKIGEDLLPIKGMKVKRGENGPRAARGTTKIGEDLLPIKGMKVKRGENGPRAARRATKIGENFLPIKAIEIKRGENGPREPRGRGRGTTEIGENFLPIEVNPVTRMARYPICDKELETLDTKLLEPFGGNFSASIGIRLFGPTGVPKVIGYKCEDHGDFLPKDIIMDDETACCPTSNCDKKLEPIFSKIVITYRCKDHGDFLPTDIKMHGKTARCPVPNCNKKLELIHKQPVV